MRKVKKMGEGPFWDKKNNDREGEEREREREMEKYFSRFSLRYMEIGSSIFVGARRKVDSLVENYAWVPKSWSFVKLYEVGNFPTLNIFSLKAI